MNEVEKDQYEPSLRLLVDYLAEHGPAKGSNNDLAKALGCVNRSVRYAIQYGVARGVVRVERSACVPEHPSGRTLYLVGTSEVAA